MRERKNSGRGSRRRSSGDGGPDLFTKQLSEVVQQAFAGAAGKVVGGGEKEAEAKVLPDGVVEEPVDPPPRRSETAATTGPAEAGVADRVDGPSEIGPDGRL